MVRQVLVDTLHFKGNFPESIEVEGMDDPVPSTDPVPTKFALLRTKNSYVITLKFVFIGKSKMTPLF